MPLEQSEFLIEGRFGKVGLPSKYTLLFMLVISSKASNNGYLATTL